MCSNYVTYTLAKTDQHLIYDLNNTHADFQK